MGWWVSRRGASAGDRGQGGRLKGDRRAGRGRIVCRGDMCAETW